MAERPARRRKPSKSVEQLKAEISARDKEKAERAAARKKSTMTPAEKYEQEKAARAKRGSSGYGYSQHLMGGSSSSSGFNPRSVREEVLVDYLLDEGFASDEKSAQAIANAMSESWIDSIVEQDLTARQRYLMKKVGDMNAEKSGSAHTYIPGKQNAGGALDRANRSAMQMRGV